MTALVTERRFGRRHLRGLGQCDPSVDATCAILLDPTGSLGIDLPSDGTSTTGGGLPTWLQNIFTGWSKTGQQIAVQQTSPLYRPGTYYQSGPYGTVLSTAGVPTTATSAAFQQSLTSMMPLLLVAGAVVLVISMAKR